MVASGTTRKPRKVKAAIKAAEQVLDIKFSAYCGRHRLDEDRIESVELFCAEAEAFDNNLTEEL